MRWLDIVQRAMHPDHKLRPAECATCGRLMDVDRTDGTLTIVMEVMDGEVTKQVFPLGCVTGVSDA